MHKIFSEIFISLFILSLFAIPQGFVSAETNIPIINSINQGNKSLDTNIYIRISGENFGATEGQVINLDTNVTLNDEGVDSFYPPIQSWYDTELTIHYVNFSPPGAFQVGENRLIIRTSTGLESEPFVITISDKIGSAIITSIESVIPGTVHVDEEIVINGSGFGTNGVDGRAGILKNYFENFHPQTIISWSTTQIRLKMASSLSSIYTGNSNIAVGGRLPDTRLYWSALFPITVSSTPLCDSDTWTCGDWNVCSASGTQTRTCTKTFDCSTITTPSPATTQSCTFTPPTCTSWIYSNWSTCSLDGQQTRDVLSSSPVGCTGGNPILQKSCTPPCTVDTWSCSDWGQCSIYGNQTRTCTKTFDCSTITTPSPATTQSCTSPQLACSADTWTCGAWGFCSLSGIQNRSCAKTFDCPNVQTAPPTTDQYCEAPNRPTQQIPQNSSDEISNQDAIIKSTVKLLCPVNTQKASQGSGTVIDPSGIILTNKHVIAGTLGCLVGFIDDFNDEPYFGERQIADIFKASSNQDIAILKIRNPQNKRLTSIDVTKGNSNLRLGTKITIYGYPAKFGTKITYTSGDFSGTDGSHLKTTAILEYGNSGGGAYLKDGTFIGIPSAVVKGELNALGYILSINTINSWLGNSSITYDGTSNNTYSRVSVLEDIDLKKLNSLKLFIPETDAKGDLSVPTTNQNTQNLKEQPQPSQTQGESTVIESTDANQKTNPEQNNSTSSEKGNNPSIKVSEQRRSVAASAVQKMVKAAERNGGVGQEIKAIAQTQTQNQEKLETGIQKIQSRSGFAKFFIGPNYGEIKNSQKLLEQSKEQIQELDQLRTQVVNQGDQLQIVEQIQLLERINQQIETLLNEAQKGFNLFGWIFRLFTK